MKVLVVDDEPMICQLAEKILTRAGFQVLLAESRNEAVVSLIKSKNEIIIAVIDLYLKETNGIDLIKEIREISTDLPCILSSGNCPDITDIPEEIRRNTYMLSKPYRPAKLVELIGIATETTNK